MKFTLFVLLAAFCVLSVSANDFMAPSVDTEYAPSEVALFDGEVIEPEEFGVIGTVWQGVKIALRCVKGLNCIIKWALGIKNSALQYNADVIVCGKNATKQVTNAINQNMKIIQTANDIINFKTNICASSQDTVAPKVTAACAVKTLRQTVHLYVQVLRGIRQCKGIVKVGSNAGQCVVDATNTLINYYTKFPSTILACSKLTGN